MTQVHSLAFVCGWETAEREYLQHETQIEHHLFHNPYEVGTDEWRGYEKAVEYYTEK